MDYIINALKIIIGWKFRATCNIDIGINATALLVKDAAAAALEAELCSSVTAKVIELCSLYEKLPR